MQYDDFVVLIDENGQPFIAHGERYQRFRSALRNSRPVKYLEKFPNLYNNGRAAYAYTEEQVRQMRNYARGLGRKAKGAAKKAAKFVDDHDAGLTERMQSRKYARQAKRASKRGNRDEFNDLATQSAKYARQAREEYNNSRVKKAADVAKKYGGTTLSAIKKAGGKAINAIDKADAGLSERIRSKALEAKANRVGKKDRDKGNEYAAKAASLRREADEEYSNSGVRKAVDRARGSKVAAAASGAAAKASGSVKGAITNARSTINDVIDRKVTGETASANLSQATINAAMGLDGAIGDYADAQRAYEQSLNSKSSGARKRAAEALADAKETVNNLLAQTGNLLSKKEKAAVQSAVNWEFDPVTGEWVNR